MPGSPEILLGTATCFEYSRSYFHAIYDVPTMLLIIICLCDIYVIITVALCI